MTNYTAIKNPANQNSDKIICFPIPKLKKPQEGNIIRFHVFMECFYADRPDWKGRALALLGHIKACLFWEELLISRKLLDDGEISSFGYRYESLLAENDQEQCRSNFQMYLMKSVRAACALNAELRNNIGKHFIIRKIKRSDESGSYNYDLRDSLKLVHDFEDSFDDNWGGSSSLASIRWDLKLKAHRDEQQLAAA